MNQFLILKHFQESSKHSIKKINQDYSTYLSAFRTFRLEEKTSLVIQKIKLAAIKALEN
jgi:hypothetical protein